MTTLCLIRHGQTDWNKKFLIQGRENNPLNEEGIIQAHITANLLLNNDSNWDVIISSPLIRAVQTAEIIKDKLNLKSPIIINNNVIEREFGAAEGLTISEEVYDRINNDDYDNLETCKELQKRSMDTIIDIVKSFPNQKILIITHSHFIKGLLTQIDSNFTWTSSLKNASINYVYFSELNIIDYKTNVEYKK